MKISIIADRIGTQGEGLETYERGLLGGLMELQSDHEYIVYGASQQALRELVDGCSRFAYKTSSPRSKIFRLTVDLPTRLLLDGADLFHVCMVPPLFCPRRFVMTVHDLAPFINPEMFPRSILMRLQVLLKKGITKAERLISVSETTKNDVVKLFNIDEGKIDVVYNGVNSNFGVIEDKNVVEVVLKKFAISQKYILYVGKIQTRKNVGGLLRAVASLKEQGNFPHKVVLAGQTKWESHNIADKIRDLRLEDDIILTGHVTDSELCALYNGADAFVYPSFFEGFGLPPLEAMACGTPVVSSSSTCLPEVLGDAALLVDPHSIDSIAQAIAQVTSDQGLRDSLMEKGNKQYQKYTWKETARKTNAVYEQVCEQNA